MGARGKREAFSKRLWKTPLHVCTCSQPFPKRLSRPEFPAFSTIAAASIGHALQHKSDPPKRQENHFYYISAVEIRDVDIEGRLILRRPTDELGRYELTDEDLNVLINEADYAVEIDRSVAG